jgi:hypothetical protein
VDRTPSASSAAPSAAVAFPDTTARPVADQRTDDATGIADVRTADVRATRDRAARVADRCCVDPAGLVG